MAEEARPPIQPQPQGRQETHANTLVNLPSSLSPDSGTSELLTVRKQIGSLRLISENTSMEGVISRFITPKEQEISHDIQGNPAGFTQMIRLTREGLEEQQQYIPSRPFLCTQVLMNQLYRSLMDSAVDAYNQGLPTAYAAYYDVAHGVKMAVTSIREGEAMLRGDMEDMVKRGLSPDEPAVYQEDMYTIMMETAQTAERLLREDNTGFLVLDDLVEQMRDKDVRKGHGLMHHMQTPELVLAGAEMAQRLYKAIYPLSGEQPRSAMPTSLETHEQKPSYPTVTQERRRVLEAERQRLREEMQRLGLAQLPSSEQRRAKYYWEKTPDDWGADLDEQHGSHHKFDGYTRDEEGHMTFYRVYEFYFEPPAPGEEPLYWPYDPAGRRFHLGTITGDLRYRANEAGFTQVGEPVIIENATPLDPQMQQSLSLMRLIFTYPPNVAPRPSVPESHPTYIYELRPITLPKT